MRPSFQKSATVGGSCARSWSPTCGPTPRTPSAGPSCAIRSPTLRRLRRARGRAVRVPARRPRSRARGRRSAPPLWRPVDAPRRPAASLRRRPRPLRPDRLAGARGARPRARADRARHRRAPPRARGCSPAPRSAGSTCSRPSRARSPRNCRAAARGAGRRCCPAASTSSASTRFPARRRAPRWASTPSGPTCCSPPTRPARSSATTARSRWRARSTSSCSPSAASIPPRRPSGSTPPTPCWCHPGTRASAWRCSRRSPATCRCSTTPVGIHPEALRGVAGTLCAPFGSSAWRAALEPHLGATESRIQGRAHAEPFSGPRLAEHVAAAWRAALEQA